MTFLSLRRRRQLFCRGNFWPNPTFAAGSNLSHTSGTPHRAKSRTGSDTTIDEVITINNAPTYALAVIDHETNQYGIWNADLPLTSSNAVTRQLDQYQLSRSLERIQSDRCASRSFSSMLPVINSQKLTTMSRATAVAGAGCEAIRN